MWAYKTDKAILEEIGVRVKQERIQLNLTQEELALRSGLGLSSVQRIERGTSVAIKYFIAVLRELQLLDKLALAFPESEVSPILLKKLEGREKKRVTKRKL